MRKNAVMVCENVRIRPRVLMKRILRKYGYSADKQEKATQSMLEQQEMLWQEWAAACARLTTRSSGRPRERRMASRL